MTTEQDPRWAAIVARDAKADALFVYGVKTTGVYCRPSSASRLPRPENIEFFDTAAHAEAAGYRPSKRAAGDQTQLAAHHAQLVAEACRQIELAETPPSLEVLAHGAGLSAFHFHRVFKAVTGLTPKAYASALRSRKVRDSLKGEHSVTDALYDAGFNSNSRFYESADQLLGMKPRDYKAGGTNSRILLRWANAHWARFWWRKANAACVRFYWAMTRTPCCATCKTSSPKPNWSVRTLRSNS